MKNIFFFLDIGFSKRDYQRFDIEKLKKYYNIYIIDLTEFSDKNYLKNITRKTNYINHFKINNLEQLNIILSNIKCDFAFDYLTENSLANYRIRKLLKNLKIKLIFFQTGLVPSTNRKFLERIHRFLRLVINPIILIKKIYLILEYKFFINLINSIRYDFGVLSGLNGAKDIRIIKAKKKIYLHNFDYEAFLNIKKREKISKNYIVFIDQYLPFHPSQFFRKEKPQATEKNYYPALNRLFTSLEKKYNTRVIIAAHPRANLNKYKKLFNYRKIVKSKTIHLVKNSKAVLAHTSTAISFAVIFKKPIIFLTSNEIIRSYDDYRVHSNARLLNSYLINIDKKNESIFNNDKIELLTKLDKNKFNQYFKNYIRHPKSTNEAIVDVFKKNLK